MWRLRFELLALCVCSCAPIDSGQYLCSANNTCAWGFVCDTSRAPPVCVHPAELGASAVCSTHDDCAGEQVCVSGSCREPSTGPDCPSGRHDNGEGECVAVGECATGFTVGPTGVCSGFFPAVTLLESRTEHTATRLLDGRVLVAGGVLSVDDRPGNAPETTVLASAELVSVDGLSSTLTGSLQRERNGHTATLLLDGRVLIVGGSGDADAEMYDPQGGTFELTAPPAGVYRGHAAVRLADGRVLVAGGVQSENGTTELFDPTSGSWSTVEPLSKPRALHTLTLLEDGRVLAAGGEGYNGTTEERHITAAELFAPSTTTWHAGLPLQRGRWSHTAIRLLDGHVLVTGGHGFEDFPYLWRRDAESFSPESLAWTDASTMTPTRLDHTSTLLVDGRVAIIGGADTDFKGVGDLFDPVNQSFTRAATLSRPRYQHTATLLNRGDVLILGGLDHYDYDSIAEGELFRAGH